MKRLLIVTIVLVMLASCTMWGWSQETRYIYELNGYDWLQWDYVEKAQYVRGFYAAHSAVRWRMEIRAEGNGGEVSNEQAKWLDEWFAFWLKVDGMIDRVDQYYLREANREAYIIDVVYLISNKDYWD